MSLSLTTSDSVLCFSISASSNVLYAKKMAPVEDFVSSFSNLSSTLTKLFMWEKKLYQEVKVS